MRKTVLLLTTFFCASLLLGQTIYKQKLSDLASIDFPEKPDFHDTLHQKIFNYNGDSATYMVIVADISFDPTFKVKPGKVNEVYEGVIAGTLKATKGRLINKKRIKIDVLDGVEIEYISNTNPNLPDRRFKRLVFFNDKIFNYDFWTLSSLKIQTNNSREKFFDSFTITADKTSLRQNTDTAYQTGYEIGYYIIGPLIIIGVIALIVYFIVRKSRS
jgi:hypothetical protein